MVSLSLSLSYFSFARLFCVFKQRTPLTLTWSVIFPRNASIQQLGWYVGAKGPRMLAFIRMNRL